MLENSGGLATLHTLVQQRQEEGDDTAMVSPAATRANGVMYLATWDWKPVHSWGGITQAWAFKGVGVEAYPKGVNVRLTFFVTGRWALTTDITDVVKEITSAPHILRDSYNSLRAKHRDFPRGVSIPDQVLVASELAQSVIYSERMVNTYGEVVSAPLSRPAAGELIRAF